MNIYDAINTLEGGVEDDPLENYKAMQALINSGQAWLLQGSYGRAAMNAIEGGYCMLGPRAHHDYWNNRVPSRDEVMDGTKGSYNFVAERQGSEWAEALLSIEKE